MVEASRQLVHTAPSLLLLVVTNYKQKGTTQRICSIFAVLLYFYSSVEILLDFRRSFTSAKVYQNRALLEVLNNITLVNSAVIDH